VVNPGQHEAQRRDGVLEGRAYHPAEVVRILALEHALSRRMEEHGSATTVQLGEERIEDRVVQGPARHRAAQRGADHAEACSDTAPARPEPRQYGEEVPRRRRGTAPDTCDRRPRRGRWPGARRPRRPPGGPGRAGAARTRSTCMSIPTSVRRSTRSSRPMRPLGRRSAVSLVGPPRRFRRVHVLDWKVVGVHVDSHDQLPSRLCPMTTGGLLELPRSLAGARRARPHHTRRPQPRPPVPHSWELNTGRPARPRPPLRRAHGPRGRCWPLRVAVDSALVGFG